MATVKRVKELRAPKLDEEDLFAAARSSPARLAKRVARGHRWSAPQLATALAFAAEWQRSECVRILLRAGARDDDFAALVAAVQCPPAMEQLLAFHNAGPDIVVGGQPLLHHAIGSESGVAWLIERGADVNVVASGVTGLHLCAHRGYVKQAQLLVRAGARRDAPTTARWHGARAVGSTPLDIATAQVAHQRRAGYPTRPWELLVKLLSSTPQPAPARRGR